MLADSVECKGFAWRKSNQERVDLPRPSLEKLQVALLMLGVIVILITKIFYSLAYHNLYFNESLRWLYEIAGNIL